MNRTVTFLFTVIGCIIISTCGIMYTQGTKTSVEELDEFAFHLQISGTSPPDEILYDVGHYLNCTDIYYCNKTNLSPIVISCIDCLATKTDTINLASSISFYSGCDYVQFTPLNEIDQNIADKYNKTHIFSFTNFMGASITKTEYIEYGSPKDNKLLWSIIPYFKGTCDNCLIISVDMNQHTKIYQWSTGFIWLYQCITFLSIIGILMLSFSYQKSLTRYSPLNSI